MARASFTVEKILGAKRKGFKASRIRHKVHTRVGRDVQGVVAGFEACAEIRWMSVIRNVHLCWKVKNGAN